MNAVAELDFNEWQAKATSAQQDAATAALERGNVVWLPQLRFQLEAAEQHLVQPGLASRSEAKNISLSPDGAELRGIECDPADLQLLRAMMWRFATAARGLV